jgi:hypothetical protein
VHSNVHTLSLNVPEREGGIVVDVIWFVDGRILTVVQMPHLEKVVYLDNCLPTEVANIINAMSRRRCEIVHKITSLLSKSSAILMCLYGEINLPNFIRLKVNSLKEQTTFTPLRNYKAIFTRREQEEGLDKLSS